MNTLCHLLDEILPQTAKLSKALQAVQLDLSAISALVDTTLHMVDAAMEPSANWILQLVDLREVSYKYRNEYLCSRYSGIH